MPTSQHQQNGIRAALLSALLLGTTPILGKLAYQGGLDPYSLTATRTLIAAGVMWFFYIAIPSNRKFIYIYPAGLLISFSAGALNGLSSLLYYNGLTRIDAGVGQMLYSLYPLFVVILRRLDGQRVSNWTKVRLAMAIVAITLLVRTGSGQVDLIGAGLMIGAGFMYAWHLAASQRVLYEMPAPTVTLYVLTAMASVVCVAYLIHGPTPISTQGVPPMLGLAIVTVFSRLLMFLGVKRLGSVQTALLGATETLIAVGLAIMLLGEQLVMRQWIGAMILMTSLILIIFEPGMGKSIFKRKPREQSTLQQAPPRP
jgi:drug/metabolite transporter (DMT)-like permease